VDQRASEPHPRFRRIYQPPANQAPGRKPAIQPFERGCRRALPRSWPGTQDIEQHRSSTHPLLGMHWLRSTGPWRCAGPSTRGQPKQALTGCTHRSVGFLALQLKQRMAALLRGRKRIKHPAILRVCEHRTPRGSGGWHAHEPKQGRGAPPDSNHRGVYRHRPITRGPSTREPPPPPPGFRSARRPTDFQQRRSTV